MVETLPDIPFEVQKQQALTRRANKLVEWLQRPEYAIYVDENSITQLIKLVDLIVWALENSLPLEDWRPFRTQFMDARNTMLDIIESEDEEKQNFYTAIPMVIATLQSYITHIKG